MKRFSFLLVSLSLSTLNQIMATDIAPLAPTQTRNYIHTKTMLSASNDQYIQDIVYTDGFGRKSQVISVSASPQGNDVVQVFRYDHFGRTENEYLPFVRMSALHGAADTNPYETTNWSVYGDEAPYAITTTLYDNSPLDRPVKKIGPGAAWRQNNKATTIAYGNNAESEVKLWHVTENLLSDGGYYAPGALLKTTSCDEDGFETIEFKDNQDRVILSQTTDGTTIQQTYLVYDEYGLLRYVLTPEACLRGIDSQALATYCYQYIYDIRNRMIEKKLPGCEPIFYVYDAHDRPVLNQDGNLRTAGKWQYTTYNMANKPIEIGEIHCDASREALAAQLAEVQNYLPDNRYTLQYYYYTDYTFTNAHPFVSEQCISNDSYEPLVPGMTTGTKTRILGTDTFILTTMYYDASGRSILTISDSYPDTTYKNYASFRYDFSGNIIESQEVCQTGPETFDVATQNTAYDTRGRILSQNSNLNGSAAVVHYTYDELGRLTGKTYGNNVCTETLEYNIRGWLTRKESPLFSMQLRYDNVITEGAKAYYNGNIAEWQWQQAGSEIQCYQFQYDALNRLLSGTQFTKQGSTWEHTDSYSEYGLSYDANGNIKTLKRKAQGLLSDDYVYSYTGNQLTSLFQNGDSRTYLYDGNGNMIQDGRNNLFLTYNNLNLIKKVEQDNINLANYSYLADGTKLAATNVAGNGLIYMGSLVYRLQNDVLTLESSSFSDGRILNTTNGYDTQYHLTDHLGSIRTIVDDDGDIIEQSDYYPYGLRWNVPNQLVSDNRYRYNGQEDQSFLDIPYTDYGARMYDSNLGKWFNIDPLLEKHYSLSSYLYCGGNPACRIDLLGLDFWTTKDSSLINKSLQQLFSTGTTNMNDNGWTHFTDDEFLNTDPESDSYFSEGSNNDFYFIWKTKDDIGVQVNAFHFPEIDFSAPAISSDFKEHIIAGAGIALGVSQQMMFSKKFESWMGKDWKIRSQNWGGNQYTGGKFKYARSVSKVLGRLGYVMSAYSVYNTERMYSKGLITTKQRNVAQCVNAISAIPVYGTAFGIGWELGQICAPLFE